METQSEGLSKRLSEMMKGGRRLNDDSIGSEGTLGEAMNEVIPYIETKMEYFGGKIEHKKTMTLYECQEYFEKVGGRAPNPENKSVYMKPDGGIIVMNIGKESKPLLIVEDKVQGTNDKLYEEKKKRQATGNAIERGGKNIRGAEMIFAGENIFPYVLFASGCDFHSSETIGKRIEMMNMGYPNHYIEVKPSTSDEDIKKEIERIVSNINIRKVCGKSIVSVFVKSHKWDEMKHGSSLWKKEEIVYILKKVIDNV